MSKKSEYQHVVFDDFDFYVSEQSGKAQDLLYEIYGEKIGQNNAEKQIAGIRKHLDFKRELAEKSREIGEMEEVVIKADGSQTTKRLLLLSEEERQDPNRIMELMGYDPLQWDCDWCKVRRNYWDVTIKNKAWEGEKHTNHAYSCEVKVTPIQDIITSSGIRRIFEDLEPLDLEEYNNQYESNLCLALPLVDNHFGKFGLTLSEQIELYKKSALDIFGQLEDYGLIFKEIILQIGQDDFHIDNSKNTTAFGTRMEVNDDWSDIYKETVLTYYWTIEQARKISNNVFVYYVPGNHDPTLSLAAAFHLEKQYEDLKSVTVESKNYPRKYHSFGVNLLGMSHGRKEGKKRIKTIMQNEASEKWGKSVYREFLLADEHHEEANEEGGIIFRRLSSITHVDDWHIGKAYVMANRKAQAFVYDEKKGKRLTIDSNVEIGVENEESSDRL